MSGSGFAQFIPLILIFVIFYFFLIRPQQKRVKEHKEMVKNLNRGDEVITSGGIIGKVDRVFDDDRLELEIADGVKVQVIRNTVQSHLKKEVKNDFQAKRRFASLESLRTFLCSQGATDLLKFIEIKRKRAILYNLFI